MKITKLCVYQIFILSTIICVHASEEKNKMFSTRNKKAWAILNHDGSVTTEGWPQFGGDSSEVQEHLQTNVKNIFSTNCAFAALKNDGSVVTWGLPQFGGDSSNVKEHLRTNVHKIFSTLNAFAALKNDGSVITWGYHLGGGNSAKVKEYLQGNVLKIVANDFAFAALKEDGSVKTWGEPQWGGHPSETAEKFLSTEIVQIESTPNRKQFRATKKDGTQIVFPPSNLKM